MDDDLELIRDKFAKYDKHTTHLSLDGIKTYGRIVDVIDGDSLNVIIPVFDNYYKFNVRLNGIDTNELKSKNEENKKLGHIARLRLGQLILNEEIEDIELVKKNINDNVVLVWLECLKFDKYGRLLANVYTINDRNTLAEPKLVFGKGTLAESLSEILVNEKLAYWYDGGRKLTEKEQLEIRSD
jgi:endonuclease YncB( thermonuclease family)